MQSVNDIEQLTYKLQMSDTLFSINDTYYPKDINGCPRCDYSILCLAQAGSYIILYPDLEYTLNDHYVLDKGAICLTESQYQVMSHHITGLPKKSDLPPLTKNECALLFDWDWNVQEQYCNKKLYLATDAPEKKGILEILEKPLTEYKQSDEPLQLTKIADTMKVTIYLDTPDYTEWQPLYKKKNGYGLLFDGGYGVQETS